MLTKHQKRKRLMELGIAPNLKGFEYILAFVDAYKPGDKITATYVTTGREVGTNASRVERAIRHAIERAVDFNPDSIPDFMGTAYDCGKGAPTNSQFLTALWYEFNQDES